MLIFLLGAYGIGNILTATLIGKRLFAGDVRIAGSGNPGARNMGRVFGKKAFVVTFICDALKGVAVVLAARWLGYNEIIQLASLFAVMLGHIFPIVHRFKGGQGVSTFIGGMLAFNPLVVGLFVAAFIVLQPLLKSFSATGLTAMSLSPAFVYAVTQDWRQVVASCLVITLLLFAHRDDFKALLNRDSIRNG
ncbi:glycerol-3-phosphate acyltransferase [Sporosarcina oncorhynchi]|uniref:Glycerol-3-phosphate acyltransferase n=1 Tax=Sporosarcina oncorhynchi TaxID=3056444 RepID=A0ABZ0L9R3_9BACL|nr:glycerol-3-phosphate acyltransferase [Sporosarcina sp. T2O-4]WOV89274.1 glycerol-3-phosphate acyltransferase [Sporosarcina sp. T2O-4]